MSKLASTEHASAVTPTQEIANTTHTQDAVASQAATSSVATAHRALIYAEPGAAKFLAQILAHGNYAVEQTESLERAMELSEEFAPEALLIEVRHETSAGFTLIRRVRAQAATYALPLVLFYRDDAQALRTAALRAGVDDYFALTTPPNELRARLESLFWRVEAGRRQALTPGDQNGEIDNFMSLLDRMRADIHDQLYGVLALVEAAARNANPEDVLEKKDAEKFDRAARDRTLREAHGFLKLNLRRRDSVAYYGPTTLLVYLPQRTERDARRVLTDLREEFLSTTSDGDIAIGLSSFVTPARTSQASSDEEPDATTATGIETLIERAELAVAHARTRDHISRIFDSDMSRRAATTQGDKAQTVSTEVTAPPVVASQDDPRRTDAPQSSAATSSAPRAAQNSRENNTVETARARQMPLQQAANSVRVPPSASPNAAPMPQSSANSSPPSVSHKATPPQRAQQRSSSSATPSFHTTRESLVRETRRGETTTGDMSLTTLVAHSRAASGGDASSEATRHAIERELERRARGEVMPRRLLLTVSDAARMAQINLLVRSAGYEARAAFDGQQALDLLRIERPDLLLLDYALQGIDGIETLRRLRKQLGGTLTLPVVLLVRETDVQARQEAIALGVRGVVTTPYDPAALLDSVRTVGKQE